MSKNLKYFSGLAMLFSVIFFHYLYTNLIIEHYENILAYAVIYGVSLFISGLILGYNDPVRGSRLDLGYYYHLVTFIIVNFVGLISLLAAMGFNTYNLLIGTLSILPWTLGLFVHYYFSNKSIKGFDKQSAFE
ncbi:MAG: hypothetical protein ABJG47_11095 [Ekhidna sp.]